MFHSDIKFQVKVKPDLLCICPSLTVFTITVDMLWFSNSPLIVRESFWLHYSHWEIGLIWPFQH